MKKKSRIKAAGSAGVSASDRLFKLIIILLAVILILMVIITGYKINSSFSDYTSTPNELLATIRNGYYPDAVNEMYDNIALGETADKDAGYMVPYAIIDYYEAESCCYAYTRAADRAAAAGDKKQEALLRDKAEEYQMKMDAARNGMGDLNFMTEDIDSIFG